MVDEKNVPIKKPNLIKRSKNRRRIVVKDDLPCRNKVLALTLK